jgi:hypothetical protein
MHAERLSKRTKMYDYCGAIVKNGPRYCGMGFGIMLVLAGAIWLATKTGWFNPELFWPVLSLVAGSTVILLSLARGRVFRTNHSQDLRKEEP